MNFYSLFSFLCFIISIEVGYYVIKRWLFQKEHGLVFLIAPLVGAFVSICFTFYYSAKTIEEAFFWYKISSIGWIPSASFVLYFVVLLTQREKGVSSSTIFFIFLPGILFTIFSLFDFFYAKGIISRTDNWYPVLNFDSIFFRIFIFYVVLFIFISFFKLMVFKKEAFYRFELKRAFVFLICFATIFPFLFLVNIVLPLLKIYAVPEMGQIIYIFLLLCLDYTLIEYNLMLPDLGNKDVLDEIKELLIMVDLKGKIIKVNRSVEMILGYKEEEILGKSVSLIVKDTDKLFLGINQRKIKRDFSEPYEIDFVSRDGKTSSLMVSWTLVKNKDGEDCGYVFIANSFKRRKDLLLQTVDSVQMDEERKKYNQCLSFLSKTVLSLLKLSQGEDIYSYIAQRISELSGDSFVFVNAYEYVHDCYQIKAFSGDENNIKLFNRMLGGNPAGIFLKIDSDRENLLMQNKMLKTDFLLYKFFCNMIQEDTCEQIEKYFKISTIYCMGLVDNGKIVGEVGIALLNGRIELQNFLLIETLIYIFSLALQSKESQKRENLIMNYLNFLFKSTEEFYNFKSERELFEYVGNRLLSFVIGSIVLVGKYNSKNNTLHYIRADGHTKYFEAIERITSCRFPGLRIKLPEDFKTLVKTGKLVRLKEGFDLLLAGVVKENIPRTIEKMIDLHCIYVFPLSKEKAVRNIVILVCRNVLDQLVQGIVESFLLEANIAYRAMEEIL